jgi:ABC-type dipeptide/oligopeptide/nickel transport system permease component
VQQLVVYTIRRLLASILVLFGVSILVFLMIHLVPGDPVEVMLHETVASEEAIMRMRQSLGLDRPLPEQYIIWLLGNTVLTSTQEGTQLEDDTIRLGVIRGDFGRSIFKRVPVSSLIAEKFPATLKLTLAALFMAIPLGLVAGIVAAVGHESPYDYLTMVGALVGVSLPSFWLGLMLMFVFGVRLGWVRPFIGDQGLITLILPAITLAMAPLAITARLTRSSMLDVLNQDYIRTAHAKGLSERHILVIHALRNAFIPVLTVLGLQFGYLLGGAVIVETVFVYPGLGSEVVSAILNRDFPVVQGVMLVSAFSFVLINLVVDLLYAAIDPRIAENY